MQFSMPLLLFVGAFVASLLYGTGSNAQPVSPNQLDIWNNYKLQYGKTYETPSENQLRMQTFLDNLKRIDRHNKVFDEGKVTKWMGINQFTDLLHFELLRMNRYNRIIYSSPENVSIPNAVDWRTAGAVTPVKDQRNCGSCWAFSAIGSLEGQHFRRTNKLVSLSEQNLIDCSSAYGNYGCNGGLMNNSFKYVKENHGIDSEESYPYEAEEMTCRFKAKNVGATDTGFVDIPSGDEDKLKEAVATVGPISVAIDSEHISFLDYTDSVYYEPQCSSEYLTHAVLVVGYGTDQNGQDYWLVKNSWGEMWGDHGYIKMSRNRKNNCGIATAASYPLVERPKH